MHSTLCPIIRINGHRVWGGGDFQKKGEDLPFEDIRVFECCCYGPLGGIEGS